MPRYFFDTEDGEAVRDMKGVELPHDEAAGARRPSSQANCFEIGPMRCGVTASGN
jgi:hypothetical protein